MIWEIIKTIILGIVEGITEWLPISSTGHLILVGEFLKLDKSDEFKEMFDVVIQLGAIMAVVVIFWKKLWPFGKKDNQHPLNKSPFGQMVKTDICLNKSIEENIKGKKQTIVVNNECKIFLFTLFCDSPPYIKWNK